MLYFLFVSRCCMLFINEPPHDKANKMAYTPSEDSDQLGHPPSLIRVFAVRMKKAWVPSYPLSAQWRLWSDWVDAQADLSLRWAHSHFVGFVMRRLKFVPGSQSVLVYATVNGHLIGCDLRSPDLAWRLKNDPKTGTFCSTYRKDSKHLETPKTLLWLS